MVGSAPTKPNTVIWAYEKPLFFELFSESEEKNAREAAPRSAFEAALVVAIVSYHIIIRTQFSKPQNIHGSGSVYHINSTNATMRTQEKSFTNVLKEFFGTVMKRCSLWCCGVFFGFCIGGSQRVEFPPRNFISWKSL